MRGVAKFQGSPLAISDSNLSSFGAAVPLSAPARSAAPESVLAMARPLTPLASESAGPVQRMSNAFARIDAAVDVARNTPRSQGGITGFQSQSPRLAPATPPGAVGDGASVLTPTAAARSDPGLDEQSVERLGKQVQEAQAACERTLSALRALREEKQRLEEHVAALRVEEAAWNASGREALEAQHAELSTRTEALEA